MTDEADNRLRNLIGCRPPPILRLLFFAALSVALIIDQRGSDHLAPLRSALLTAVYPVQQAAGMPESAYHWLSDNFSARSNLIEENAQLKAQQALLQAQVQRYISLEMENRDLRELLDARSHLQERSLVSELVAVDMAEFSRHITINKGSADKVFSGQPVLDATGVIGQVHHVSPVSSTVILLTDPDHALPVQVNRNGLRGVLMGSGPSNRMTLAYVPNSADIVSGDQLVTSGLGGHFPAGFPVGKVVSVNHDPGKPFAQVSVQPSAHPDRSRRFILMWPHGLPAQPGPGDQAPAQPIATDNNDDTAMTAALP